VNGKGEDFIKAVHANGKTQLKILPLEYLASGQWWVKK
jgi:hypothetical protein